MPFTNEFCVTIRTGVLDPPRLVPTIQRLSATCKAAFADSDGLTGTFTGGYPVESCHTEVDVTVLAEPPTRPAGVTAICVMEFKHDGSPIVLKTDLLKAHVRDTWMAQNPDSLPPPLRVTKRTL